MGKGKDSFCEGGFDKIRLEGPRQDKKFLKVFWANEINFGVKKASCEDGCPRGQANSCGRSKRLRVAVLTPKVFCMAPLPRG